MQRRRRRLRWRYRRRQRVNPAEGSPTWYLDADQDLFGDENNPVVSCLAPADHVAAAGDCNDSDPFIHPDADEECTDSIDENCDGDPVYGVPTDLLPTWYPDSDGDTYGNPDFVIQLCVQPQNYVANAGDCNDTDFYVHPQNSAIHAGELEPDGHTLMSTASGAMGRSICVKMTSWGI